MQEKEKVEAAAIQAMQTRDAQGNPQITYPDYLFIKRILEGGNIRYAEVVLAHRINKRIEQAQMIAQQNSEMNAKIQQQSAMAKMEADAQLIQIQTQSKLQLIEAEKQKDIEVAIVKGEIALEEERIRANAKEELQVQQNLVDLYKNDLMKQKIDIKQNAE